MSLINVLYALQVTIAVLDHLHLLVYVPLDTIAHKDLLCQLHNHVLLVITNQIVVLDRWVNAKYVP